jgi:hypothetical protein
MKEDTFINQEGNSEEFESLHEESIKRALRKASEKKVAKDQRLIENKPKDEYWKEAKEVDKEINNLRDEAKKGNFSKISELDFLRDSEYLLKIALKYRHLDKVPSNWYEPEDLDQKEIPLSLEGLDGLEEFDQTPLDRLDDLENPEDFDDLSDFDPFDSLDVPHDQAISRVKTSIKTPEEKELENATALEIAAKYKNFDQIPKEKLSKEAVNSQEDEKESLLEIAAIYGSLNQIPEEIIEKDYLEKSGSSYRENFLILAIRNGNFKQVPKSFKTQKNLTANSNKALEIALDYYEEKKGSKKALNQLKTIVNCFSEKAWQKLPKNIRNNFTNKLVSIEVI